MLLVEAPFEPLQRGRLAPALLKAELRQIGIACHVEHLGPAFAARLGREEYARLIRDLPPPSLAQDWAFAGALFGSAAPAREAYVSDVLRRRWRLPGDLVDLALRARGLAAGFVRQALAEVDWARYEVLGFSAPVGQCVAALAIARAVKQAHPHCRVVFGGPAWHGVMGERLLAELPFVDAACTGEGDEALPEYCVRLATGERPGGCGLVLQSARPTRRGRGAPRPVPALDALPAPDYSDLYDAIARWGGDARAVQLAAESSRGCWWATRTPCAFCGLNGETRGYRCKSASRTVAELRGLDRRWRPWLIDLVDNVVPPAFLRGALPQLAAEPLAARLFFEARPELTRAELRLAARAGAHVQLGIESLSQHVLDLSGKGTDARGNAQQLRWCRQEGVPVTWNLLYGFPGETADDYREMRQALRDLRRLPPPEGRGAVEVQRFSRYFARPTEFGLVNLRPAAAYSYVYPFAAAALRDIAYLFDHDLLPAAPADGRLERERAAFLREADAWTASASAQSRPAVA